MTYKSTEMVPIRYKLLFALIIMLEMIKISIEIKYSLPALVETKALNIDLSIIPLPSVFIFNFKFIIAHITLF